MPSQRSPHVTLVGNLDADPETRILAEPAGPSTAIPSIVLQRYWRAARSLDRFLGSIDDFLNAYLPDRERALEEWLHHFWPALLEAAEGELTLRYLAALAENRGLTLADVHLASEYPSLPFRVEEG